MLFSTTTYAQDGFGDPVYIQTFGEGNDDPTTIGQPLRPEVSGYTFSNQLCPPPGSYTIVRRINVNGCFNNSWIDLGYDHTTDDFGNMMVINNEQNSSSRLVYVDTVNQSLCPGARYQFFMAAINLTAPTECTPAPSFPVFAMNIEDLNGQVLFTDTTYPLGYASPYMGYRFAQFGFGFNMPSLSAIVIRITTLKEGWACAEDFAVDNILIRPVGPDVTISFDNEPGNTIVRSVCFQNNQTISMSGTMGDFYQVPVVQWQQSTDMGQSWVDIPGATFYNYSRTFSAADTFLFRLTGGESSNMSNPKCRVRSNIIKVEVDDLPRNLNVSSNSPVCAGQTLKFSSATGWAGYEWRGPNGFYDNVPYAQISDAVLRDSGMYYVEITSFGGCKTTDSTFARIIGTDVDAWPDTSICIGQQVTLKASAGVNYAWTPSSDMTGVNSQSAIVSPKTATTYTVKVTDQYGCSDTAHVTVKLKNSKAVEAAFSSEEYLCLPSDSSSFIDLSLGVIESWQWTFGNGQTASVKNPSIQFYSISPGEQSINARLIVTDTAGCADTLVKQINIANNCYIAVPTAFSPNGDGLNDFLYPVNAYKATNLKFRIFDRNGQTVFTGNHWSQKWDGRVRGKMQSTGVYVWILEYVDARKQHVFLKGTTTLIR